MASSSAQLKENRLYSSRNNRRHQYLLGGLIRCPRCGGSYTGYHQHGSRGYRCNRAHWTVSSTGKRCTTRAVPAQLVEDAAWDAIKEAIQSPDVLMAEHTRRLGASGSATDLEFERKQVTLGLKRVKV